MKKKINIKCGYRIHINSIDMNGFSGRGCGGLGFALDNPELKLSVSIIDNDKDIIKSKYNDKVKLFVENINKKYGLNKHYKIVIDNECDEHTGLGSETQLILSLASAILKLNNIDQSVDDIVLKLQLAGVSGIGYGAYKYGNFVVDSGYIMGDNKKDFVSHSSIPPKILVNYNVPTTWKVLLVIPKKIVSISSEEEDKFFSMYTPVPEKEVKEICYYTFMGVLPAILENNFDEFIKSLKKITKIGTKKAELKINEKNTKDILIKLENMFGFSALSSLGPTCYTFINEEDEKIDVDKISNEFKECDIILTSIRNSGYSLTEDEYE